ncbi:MAG: YiiX/YebB-like N1pC/P60 family cysteine hydrolase [Flavobacteriales bacterium]
MRSRSFIAVLLFGALVLAFSKGPVDRRDDPALREGDILFQRTGGAQGKAVRLATGSPWTHVGILFKDGDVWMVYEAIGPVIATPLSEWVDHGTDGHFTVKRWKEAGDRLDAPGTERLRKATEAFLGLPYDLQFGWSDARIYCSELVWKAYERGLGVELCAPKPMREHDLGDPIVQRTMKERYGNTPPLDELMIAPGALFDCPMLVTVLKK